MDPALLELLKKFGLTGDADHDTEAIRTLDAEQLAALETALVEDFDRMRAAESEDALAAMADAAGAIVAVRQERGHVTCFGQGKLQQMHTKIEV